MSGVCAGDVAYRGTGLDENALTTLDALSPGEIDALPFGVVQVDARGTILLYNAAESRFSGRAAADVIGRDFFRSVAPCTNLPAFRGRFLDGVRRGQLDHTLEFVFGFEPPQRVRVTMRSAAEPGRYWLAIEPLGALQPTRQRMAAEEAADAVDRRSRAEPVDASVCEREPIHIPGAVQPHAAMLALDPATLVVTACSDNVADALELSPGEVLGRTLETLLPAHVVDGARAQADRPDTQPWRGMARLGADADAYAVTAHTHDGRLIVEIEMLPERPEDFGAATPAQAQDAVARLRAAPSLEAAASACAEDIRRMTGFQRVLVYQFDEDWNGEAVGESRDADYSSLLGLRFPASDIPAQARALYTRAPARFVVDRDAVPAAVLAEPAAGNQTVDLSHAYSRALSPIHLEYQRNLGVNGSMSISILVDGALWGLVIGHHRRPHYITPDTRALAGLVTDAFALRIHELETTAAWREQQAALQHQNALLERLAGADDFIETLTDPGPGRTTLLDLFEATGAAVVAGDRMTCIGRTPCSDQLTDLADWLRGHLGEDERVFATADLSEHWAPGEGLRDIASGLLAAFVDPERRVLLMWFRGEVASTVTWGGDPTKPVLADGATRTVLPRRSFERWVEERRGQAEPWADWYPESAAAFAAALEGVVLRQGRKIAELSAKQRDLSAALEQKDLLAREIDHRVKNSLQIVASVMLLQARRVVDEDAKAAFQNTYARVMSVARVHDSLQQSADAEMVDLGQTVRQLCNDLAAGMSDASRRVEVEAEAGLMVPSRTAVALALIATELVTNALKYAYPDGEGGPIAVQVKGAADGLTLRVCDEGQGLPEDWDTRPREHGGLGMRVIRAMLQQIDGALHVDGVRRQGTCFTVTA